MDGLGGGAQGFRGKSHSEQDAKNKPLYQMAVKSDLGHRLPEFGVWLV